MTSIVVAWPRRRAGSELRRAAAAAWTRWWARRMEARRRRKTRRYLGQMDDHMLSDLGVSRAQLFFELDRARDCPPDGT